MSEAQDTDLLIVGGGPAGLSCALMFARLHRPAILYDSGLYRNANAKKVYTVPGHDGEPPQKWREDVTAEICTSYPWITLRRQQIVHLVKNSNGPGFEATDDAGVFIRARKVVIATGLKDNLAPIPGLMEAWGTKVVHCIFCHGTETRFSPLAFLLDSSKPVWNPMAVEASLSIWPSLRKNSDTFYLTDGLDITDEAQLAKSGLQGKLEVVKAKGYQLITEKIQRVEDTSEGLLVHFQGDIRAPLAIGYLAYLPNSWSPNPHSASFLNKALLGTPLSPMGTLVPATGNDLAGQSPLPPLMGIDPRTSTPGLFWAGNAGSFLGNFVASVSQGQMAAFVAAKDLGDEDLAASLH